MYKDLKAKHAAAKKEDPTMPSLAKMTKAEKIVLVGLPIPDDLLEVDILEDFGPLV